MEKPKKKGNLVTVLSAEEAVKYIPNEAIVAICGAGGGLLEPTKLIEALSKRYEETHLPKDLTFIHTTGLGDRADRGMSPLAKKGLVRKIVGGHWGQSPRLCEMAENNEIEAYNFPQGVLCQLFRAAAAGHPGILTHVGLGSFIDPRQKGGKLNDCTKEDLIKLMEINGE
ncbi:Coenzyme A transferase [Priestia megaterium]|nr:Coenzyme A transferase [Priestia megaterium]